MKKVRLALIGPGDVKFHYLKLLGFEEKRLMSELEQIALSIAKSGAEIELLPDDGVCIEIARRYKKNGGKKVIGTVPKSDKTFGTKHLESYMNEKADGKPLFDEIIDSGDWFRQDMLKGLFGDAMLYLGSSPGADGEMSYAVYLYKLLAGFKKGIEVSGRSLHPEIRAGKDYTLFVYSPFLFYKKLTPEEDVYAKKFGIKVIYVHNPKELRDKLKEFSKRR